MYYVRAVVHILASVALGFVCVMFATGLAMLIALILGMTPEIYAVLGVVIVFNICAWSVIQMDGMEVRTRRDYLKPKAVIVWFPIVLGNLLFLFSSLFFWLGLWMSMTFAVHNVRCRRWEAQQQKIGEGNRSVD